MPFVALILAFMPLASKAETVRTTLADWENPGADFYTYPAFAELSEISVELNFHMFAPGSSLSLVLGLSDGVSCNLDVVWRFEGEIKDPLMFKYSTDDGAVSETYYLPSEEMGNPILWTVSEDFISISTLDGRILTSTSHDLGTILSQIEVDGSYVNAITLTDIPEPALSGLIMCVFAVGCSVYLKKKRK